MCGRIIIYLLRYARCTAYVAVISGEFNTWSVLVIWYFFFRGYKDYLWFGVQFSVFVFFFYAIGPYARPYQCDVWGLCTKHGNVLSNASVFIIFIFFFTLYFHFLFSVACASHFSVIFAARVPQLCQLLPLCCYGRFWKTLHFVQCDYLANKTPLESDAPVESKSCENSKAAYDSTRGYPICICERSMSK